MLKRKLLYVLLFLSLGLNLYIAGKWFLLEQPYQPTEGERQILNEMLVKTLESEEYKEIAKKEDVVALDYGIDKLKGGVYPYNMEISVRTDKQTYLFFCADKQCSSVENEGWTYSIYKDQAPILPKRSEELAQDLEKKVLSYLLEKDYKEKEINDIEVKYNSKIGNVSDAYYAYVVFEDDKDMTYVYENIKGKIVQTGFSGPYDIGKHAE